MDKEVNAMSTLTPQKRKSAAELLENDSDEDKLEISEDVKILFVVYGSVLSTLIMQSHIGMTQIHHRSLCES